MCWVVENTHGISKPISRLDPYTSTQSRDNPLLPWKILNKVAKTHPLFPSLTYQFPWSSKIHNHATMPTKGFPTIQRTIRPLAKKRQANEMLTKLVSMCVNRGVRTTWVERRQRGHKLKGGIWNMWTTFGGTIGGLTCSLFGTFNRTHTHSPTCGSECA